MTDVNDSFRYCMQIFAHLCTSVSSYMAETIAGWTSSCRCCPWTNSGRKTAWRGEESWAYYTPKSCLGGLMLCIWYVQTRWSPPCDLGTINKHIKELNHKFALHIDSSWLVAFQHLYVNTKDLPWKEWSMQPATDHRWMRRWMRTASAASQRQGLKFARLGSEISQKWDVDIHGSVTIICVI